MQAQLKNTASLRQSPQFYYWIIGSLCLMYLAIQLGFISYEKLTVDDLWLSYHTYQFKSLLPYRDFSPYKTTLGYYVLLIPLSLFNGVIMPLLCTKAFVAFINAVLLSITGVVFPADGFIRLLPELNGQYQKYTLNLSNAILADGGDYVAGEPLLYNKNLSVPGLNILSFLRFCTCINHQKHYYL